MSKVKDDDDDDRGCSSPGDSTPGDLLSATAAPVADHGKGNSGGANPDFFPSSLTGLTEDNLGKVVLDVLANDSGPKKSSLWALDDGISALQRNGDGHATPVDLLHQEIG